MKRYLIIAIVLIILLSAGAAFYLYRDKKTPAKQTEESPTPDAQKEEQTTSGTQEKIVAEPIESAKSRITKKPFGIHITPATSPIQPEKFSGFHTGTDFEITGDERDREMPVFAISDGVVVEIHEVSGYGGVIVQSANVKGENITVLYGHILINESFSPKRGDKISAGQKIAILTPDKSRYSGGERKHLHLGIHKGASVVYAGYVNLKEELSAWLNVENLL